MENKILFESKGVRDVAGGAIAIIAFVIALVLFIVALVIPDRIGPWYLYAIAMIICGFLIYAVTKMHGVIVHLKENNDHELFLSVTGKANNVEFKIEGYRFWYFTIVRGHRNGGHETKLFFEANSNNMEKLCFTESTLPVKMPDTWSFQKATFPFSQKTFLISNLVGLVDSLEEIRDRNQKK